MNKIVFLSSGILLLAVWLLAPALDHQVNSVEAAAASARTADAITAAVEKILGKLGANQKKKTLFAFSDDERLNWHFIPRPRKGLPLSEMNPAQKKLVQELLVASLGETGTRTVNDVRSLESILQTIEGPNRRFSRDPEHYYLSVFGAPGKKEPWGWRFEGHHLCVNFTLEGKKVLSSTPLFYGANPAIVKSGPKKGLRVLGKIEDLGRELMLNLDKSQLKTALGKGKPEEVKATQSATYNANLPTGLAGRDMNKVQTKILTNLVLEHTKNMDESLRKEMETSLSKQLGNLQIAWRGKLEPDEGHSFIVHGPAFIISFSNFQNNAAHIHSSLRARKGEFGLGGEK